MGLGKESGLLKITDTLQEGTSLLVGVYQIPIRPSSCRIPLVLVCPQHALAHWLGPKPVTFLAKSCI